MEITPKDYENAGLASLLAMRQASRKTQSTAPKLIVQQPGGATSRTVRRKVGRNELCPCGSGRKFKKCHGSPTGSHSRPVAKRPKERPVVEGASVTSVPKAVDQTPSRQATAQAMRRNKVAAPVIWAYLRTGLFISDTTRGNHSDEELKAWDAALADYSKATPEERRDMVPPPEEGA